MACEIATKGSLSLVLFAGWFLTIVMPAPTLPEKVTAEDVLNSCQPYGNQVSPRQIIDGILAGTPLTPELREERYERIRQRATIVKDIVLNLKKRFMEDRFNGDSIMSSNLENSDLNHSNMPKVDMHVADTSDLNPTTKVKETFHNIASSLVYINQARQDEINYEHSAYADTYKEIERGLYATLCSLVTYMNSQNLKIEERTIRSIESMTIKDNSHPMVRRVTAFIILRDLDRLLYAVSRDFTSLIDIARIIGSS